MAIEVKPNSYRYKEEQENEKKEIHSVVQNKVTIKKDTLGKKFSDTFLADNVRNVGSYVVSDVVIPAIVDTIVDGLTSAINMLFKGDPTPRRKSSGSRTNYTTYSRSSGSSKHDREERRYVKDRYGLINCAFETRGDAIEVRDCMMEIYEKYDLISVADYYNLCGISDQSTYTDRNYGWDDLKDLQISRDRDGYHINLPRPEPIN